MIDIHSHIVFDVDDGPKSREESKALLVEAYNQGVRTIVSIFSPCERLCLKLGKRDLQKTFFRFEIAKEVAVI